MLLKNTQRKRCCFSMTTMVARTNTMLLYACIFYVVYISESDMYLNNTDINYCCLPFACLVNIVLTEPLLQP